MKKTNSTRENLLTIQVGFPFPEYISIIINTFIYFIYHKIIEKFQNSYYLKGGKFLRINCADSKII